MENEIRKNIRGILGNLTKRGKSVWKRTGEILIEMGIIIFAVSFAVWMERKREHNHEQKEAREFLIGLRIDLLNDIREMEEDKKGYLAQAKWFAYFSNPATLDRDTVKKYEWVMWNSIHLIINNGRYEGFKASGRINTIGNMELRSSILDLYQESLVSLTSTTSVHVSLKKDLHSLVYKRLENDNKGNNLVLLLQDTEIRNYCSRLKLTGEPVRRYDSAINQSRRIVAMIDKEYPGEK
jgi:hypothetical protein